MSDRGTHFSFCSAKPYRSRLDEIDAFFEANSEPTGLQLAERILTRSACWYQDEPDRFGEELWNIFIGEVITLEQAAHLALPLMSEIFGWEGDSRERFGIWVQTWLLEKGLDREVAVGILKTDYAQR
jgi:hypothetical protein